MIASTTSVTTLKTTKFSTPLGNFDYHSIKPELFSFGYSLDDINSSGNRRSNGRMIMIATPQKAILDFFYVNSFYNSLKEMENLRLNDTKLAVTINEEFYRFLAKYESMALERRIKLMIKAYGL